LRAVPAAGAAGTLNAHNLAVLLGISRKGERGRDKNRTKVCMKLPRQNRFSELEPLLLEVEKPARYINHEWGATAPKACEFHACMMYPDVYEVGQPNMGVAILYNAVNACSDMSCERAYVPWPDMADAMRAAHVPLLALESAAPVASFDVVGISMAHEMAATNVLEALDLAGIPVRAEARGEDDAFILAGGPSVWNIEPLAPVFDVVQLGEGEEAFVEVCRCVKEGRAEGASREAILRRIAQIPGQYVPSLYDVVYDEAATRWGRAVPRAGSGAPAVVTKRLASDFCGSDPLATTIVPYMTTIQDRLSIEVLRGCARGCRFCQAGITYRPVRERSVKDIAAAIAEGIAKTGYDEVSLSSLSTTDHSCIQELLHQLNEEFKGTGVRISIPSQRLDSFGVEMAAEVAGAKKGGLTFAPEAGTQRLRDVINKNVTVEDLERAASAAFTHGWRRCKLYFMMGLPTERDEDIVAIGELANRVLEIGRASVPPAQKSAVSVSVGVSVFVPKAHTPFQWEGQLPYEEVRRRQQLLLKSIPSKAIRVSYHDAETSLLEAVLSRTGRDAFRLIEAAWARGARFDAWTEHFSFNTWLEAARAVGFDLFAIAAEPLPHNKTLPWDHTTPGVSKDFLEREWRAALEAATTPDCTREHCTACGMCPALHAHTKLEGVRA
jgi:radical SAM family uncharacterized protein